MPKHLSNTMLSLPTGTPVEVIWCSVWAAAALIGLGIFQALLWDRSNQRKNRAHASAYEKLPRLNDQIWRLLPPTASQGDLVLNSTLRLEDELINSVDDFVKFLRRVTYVNSPLMQLRRISKNADYGRFWCIAHVVAAITTGALFLYVGESRNWLYIVGLSLCLFLSGYVLHALLQVFLGIYEIHKGEEL